MNCVNCYHYQSCASIDVTSYVVDREKTSEEACEHFITPENVNPTSHWERKVYKHLWSTYVRVQYECHHCQGACERVYSHDIVDVNMWNGYLADNWKPKNGLSPFCPHCGAKMDLDKTDHTNWVTID